MPAYSFEAVDAQGDTRRGVLEADTARTVRNLLRAQTLVPLRVEPVGPDNAASDAQANRRWRRRVLGAQGLAVWTRQLAALVDAGLPLERALTALTDDASTDGIRNLVASLRAEVNGGATFARALSLHPREFSEIYVAVVAAGEQSGHLGAVLQRLADDLEARQALRSRLIGAALYPAIVTVVALVIVLFLMGYVVPQVTSVFAGTKRALPWLTSAMLLLSEFVRAWGGVVLAAMAAGAIGLRIALRQDALRERFDAAWLKLPLVGTLARGYNAARFAATLAMLAAAGVPILRALQAAAQTLNNRAMRTDALDALALVREGAPLASALSQKKRFPGLLAMFARLGEQTGQLPSMLQRAAAQLSGEVQRRAMQWATVLEPLLVVLMGAVVLLIVLAVMLPIIQLNQFAR